MQLLNTGGEGGKRDWKGKRGLGRKKRRGGYHWMIAVYYERRGGLCIFLFIGWVGFRSLSPAFRSVSLSVSFVKSVYHQSKDFFHTFLSHSFFLFLFVSRD